MNIGAAVFILGYMVILGIIGWQVERRRKEKFSIEQYFVAGGQIGFIHSFLTALATGFSAFTFLGGIGLAYDLGIDGLILGGGAAIICTPAVVFVGKRLWALGKKYNYVTPSDFLADRFSSDVLRVVTGVVFVVFSFFYIQVQLVGTGYIISTLTGGLISYSLAIVLVGIVMIFYVTLGGMRAVIWTDSIQAVLLFLGLVVIGLYAITAYPTATVAAVQEQQNLARSTHSALYLLSVCIGYGLSVCVWPQFYVRYFTARDRAGVFSIGVANDVGMIVLLGLFAAIIGYAGVSVFPGIKADKTTVNFIQVLPLVLAWPMAAAGTAAAQSTADSILITVSSIAVKDWYLSFTDKYKDEADTKLVRNLSRLSTVLIASIAVVVALNPPQLLLKYILDISYPGFLLMLPPTVAGLFWKRATAKGALAGIGCGLVVLLVTTFIWKDAFNVYPGIWALIANVVALVLGSVVTKPVKDEKIERIHGFLEKADYKSLEASVTLPRG